MQWRRIAVLGALMALAGVFPCRGQQAPGPLPPPTATIKQIPVNAAPPPPPPIPVEEIIHKFVSNEDAYKRAYLGYSLQQTVRVQEFAEDIHNASGEFQLTGELYLKPDGQRYERILAQPVSSLHRTVFTVEDVKTIANLPQFFLSSDELGRYDLSYQGTEKIDELNTYIFRVKPKQLERGRRLFEGVVWVDDHDLAIVKSYGRFAVAVESSGPTLPFTLFETYREFIDGKYWFPTYTRSDDVVPSGKNQIPIRLTIRSTEFKQLPMTPAAPGTPTARPERPSPASPPQD